MWFKVRALSADDLLTNMRLDAVDEEHARLQVEAKGLRVISLTAASKGVSGVRRKGKFPVLLFSQELLALLGAGLSIVETLEALREKEANEASHAILSRMVDGLKEGKRFSDVLAEQQAVFPPLYVGIVQAAEGTSNLPQSLTRYVDYQQRINGIREKVVSALIYPLILLIVGGGVTFFLVGYVVPRFAEVYQGAGRNLPGLSALLLDAGRFITEHRQAVLLGALLWLVTAGAVLHRAWRNGSLGRLAERVPGFGQRIRLYALSRLYLTLGMLLQGGIPVVSALRTTQSVVGADIREQLQHAVVAIESGMPLSLAFEQRQLTTPVSLRLLRAGERSGEVGQMLIQAASFYDGEISRWIDRFTRTFEPALMTAIGLIVGAIVVLLYMPIFDLAGSLS